MTVATDDVVGVSFDGAFEDAVIVGVIGNHLEDEGGSDDGGNGFQFLAQGDGGGVGGVELAAQLFVEFIEEQGGCDQGEGTLVGKVEELTGESTELEGGDDDVGIGDDANHRSGAGQGMGMDMVLL